MLIPWRTRGGKPGKPGTPRVAIGGSCGASVITWGTGGLSETRGVDGPGGPDSARLAVRAWEPRGRREVGEGVAGIEGTAAGPAGAGDAGADGGADGKACVAIEGIEGTTELEKERLAAAEVGGGGSMRERGAGGKVLDDEPGDGTTGKPESAAAIVLLAGVTGNVAFAVAWGGVGGQTSMEISASAVEGAEEAGADLRVEGP